MLNWNNIAGNAFAFYKLPNNKPKICWQNNDELYQFQEITQNIKGFVCQPFKNGNCPSFFIKAENELDLKLDDLSNVDFTNLKEKAHLSATSKTTFIQLVNDIQSAIKQGKIKKAIASKIEWINGQFNPIEIFNQACQAYPNAFVYFWHHPKIGSWLGATPETFIRLKNGIAKTMALAGTQPINNTNWTDKEIEEQALVTQHIQTTCENLNLAFSKSETQSVNAGQVAHLKTGFSIQVSDNQTNDLINALHPTPAVCGLPKIDALTIINQFENHKRLYYCGFLGPVNGLKKLDLFVNLRCMQIFANGVALYLGAGITAASVAQKEWEETALKSQTLKKVIQGQYA